VTLLADWEKRLTAEVHTSDVLPLGGVAAIT